MNNKDYFKGVHPITGFDIAKHSDQKKRSKEQRKKDSAKYRAKLKNNKL